MSATMPVEILRDESCCSICLEIFQDPVSIHCGHSFCWSCITQTWEGRTTNFSCPKCREMVAQKTLRPNWELGNMIEAAKRMNLPTIREVEGGENLCEEHQEPLKLFCQDDKRLICVVCDRSKVHRDHSVLPLGEAAQQYKKQIQTQLQGLKSEQEELQSSVTDRQDRIKDHAERTEAAKQEIVRTYRKMHEFLEKQESSLLAQLEQLDTEIRTAHEEILQRLLEETTNLGTQIGEMERTYQQPDWQLLKDMGTTLSRGQRETLSHSLNISPELERKFSDFTDKNSPIKELLEKYQDFLDFVLHLTSEPNVCPIKPSYEIKYTLKGALLPPKIDLKCSDVSFPPSPMLVLPPAQMTLDPETANANLYLSEDCKLVRWKRLEQDLPGTNPGRFKFHPCVLGSRGFTSGWHRWDVEVHREGAWAIGVVKESVPRGRGLCLKPEEGVWALRHTHDGYEALTSPYATPLTLQSALKRVRICLDYEEGKVVFFDADSKERIFAFPPASFQGERVFPWFVVMGDAQLKLLP